MEIGLKKYLGVYLKLLRIAHGKRSHEVAKFLGISTSHMRNIEGGRTAVSLYLLIDFCEFLGIDPKQLLNTMYLDYQIMQEYYK